MNAIGNNMEYNFVPFRVGTKKIGEFGRVLNGRQNHHGGACCWVTLKEK